MKRIAGFLIVIGLATCFASLARAQATPAVPTPSPAWQSDAEAEMGLAAQNEKDPARQLDLLKKWEQQYPNSAYKNQRTLLTAKALLTITGAAFTNPAPASLDAGQKAAQQLIAGFTTYFDPSVKPGTTSEAQWSAVKQTAELQAHALLAQIAVTKKDDAAAESEYKKILAIDPTQAATSFQLGGAILRQMAKSGIVTPARYSEALYHLARSLAVTGPNALAAAGQTAALNSLRKNYANYHGDPSGMDDLIKQASSSAVPPAGFHILSLNEVAAIRAEEHDQWAKEHPELDLWQTIRAALESKGDDYFTSSLKDVGLPPPPGDYKGAFMFSANVVSVLSSKELLVSVDNASGDARLAFDENIKGDIPAGTAIRFKGVVDAYTAKPSYLLTLNIEDPKVDITGLPDTVTFVPDPPGKPKPGTHNKTPSKSAKTAAR
jgi:hypothetical protein